MPTLRLRLASVNNVLLTLIILVDGYIIVAPFIPAISYDWHKHQGDQTRLSQQLHVPAKPAASPVQTQPNHAIIPAMILNAPIYDGPIAQQYKILDKGIWRWPNGSTPDKGGNTVLIGHRFTYTNPRGIFYYLNKVSLGDEIGVWWDNKQYLYKVATVKVVSPNDSTIEAPTKQPELTLFTCTPLWLPKNRLVVVANLETRP